MRSDIIKKEPDGQRKQNIIVVETILNEELTGNRESCSRTEQFTKSVKCNTRMIKSDHTDHTEKQKGHDIWPVQLP